MMRFLGLGVALLALVGAGGPVTAASRLHHPPDFLVVSGAGRLTVVGEVDGRAPQGRMEVRLNGQPAARIVARARVEGATVWHGGVQLEPGLNTIEVTFHGDGPAPTVLTRRAFFFHPLSKDRDPPPGFSRMLFHRAGRGAACEGCHEVTSRVEDMGPSAPEQSTCFSCHARITRGKEVHGPAASWACTRCHDPTAAPGRHVTPEPVMPLCFSCHTQERTRQETSPFQHGPTATGICTICHDPHATDNQFFLKKAPTDLCITCHAEKATERHVIAWGPSGGGHPVRGRPDPKRPGRELSCASCHNPHAAPSAKLWNFGAVMWLDLCRNCHQRLVGW